MYAIPALGDQIDCEKRYAFQIFFLQPSIPIYLSLCRDILLSLMNGLEMIDIRTGQRSNMEKENAAASIPLKKAPKAKSTLPAIGVCDKHTLKNLPLTKAHFLDAYSKVCWRHTRGFSLS